VLPPAFGPPERRVLTLKSDKRNEPWHGFPLKNRGNDGVLLRK